MSITTADLCSPARYAEAVTGGKFQRPRHIQALDAEVMATLLGDYDILVAMAPPRSGKSEYLSKWLPSWYTNAWSSNRVISTSYSMSLARIASRFARDQNHKDAPIWGRGGVNRLVSGATDWQTVDGGGMLAAGVGGGITGRAANLFLIDDCLKNAEQALSEKIRESQWEWFQTTAFTRLEPGGKLILLGCLVGDTPVSVPGGTVPIRDIRPGDIVETFREGKLSRAKVRNHACVGQDRVFCITLKSGRIVLGNERHPFLVSEDGVLKWIRLKNLQVGSRLIVNVNTPIARTRHSQEASAESTTLNSLQVFQRANERTETESTTDSASGMDARNQQKPKGIAAATIQSIAGNLDTECHRRTQNHTEKPISNIVTELPWSSMKRCFNPKVESVQYAESHLTKEILESIKTGIFSSTTAMNQREFEVLSATPAILQQDTLKPLNVPFHLLDTSVFMSDEVMEVRPEGIEAVYDVEVEETENFIANGIVTHNTRWHAADLLGRVLDFVTKETTLRIREVRFQAIAELEENQTDMLGRVNGEALWPERWPVESLLRIKSALADYWWQALYQQNLTQHGSNEWPESYFWGIMVEPEDWPENLVLSATALDPSKGKDAKKGDYQAIVNTGYRDGYLWVECDVDRRPVPEMIDTLVRFNMRVRPTVTGIESVAFQELLASDYLQAQLDYAYYDQPELIPNTVPKRIRIARLGYWLRRHRIKIKNNASGQLMLKQMKDFPNGDHDDGCFAAGTLIQTNRGNIPIEDVVEGDEVWTRHGWTKVLASQCTGVKPVSKYLFEQGISLLATSEHPVYSQGHFQPIQYARSVELCLNVEASELNQSQCFSMESSSRDIQKRSSHRTNGISHRMELIAAMGSRHFIVKYGKATTDRSQKACIFTTKTETHSITQLTTSLVSLNKSTQNCTEKTLARGSKENDFLKKLSPKQRSGTSQMKAGIGTVSTPKRLQMESNQKNAPASSAESHSSANIHTKQPTAVRSAGKDNTQSTMEHSLDSMTCNAKSARSDSGPKSVVLCSAHQDASSVSAIGSIYLGEMPVYNMTTQNGEYTANGIVVHNCDALEMSIRLLLSICDTLQDVMSADGGADAASILEP